MRGPEPYVVADAPGRTPQIVIHPGERCATVDGRDLHDEMTLGVRTWGNDAEGSTVMLTGTYAVEGAIGDRLLGGPAPPPRRPRRAQRRPHWRLALAADLLLEPSATVASVARRVGYASPYALSAAFSRVRGISPRAHKAAQLVGAR